mmetsp:Transcript_22492/g.53108  ORF Transcript_22492/g.53108 Transcript_22492/m.53108 type:complete len:206 (+) Transcript_22492:1762-2379(+)
MPSRNRSCSAFVQCPVFFFAASWASLVFDCLEAGRFFFAEVEPWSVFSRFFFRRGLFDVSFFGMYSSSSFLLLVVAVAPEAAEALFDIFCAIVASTSSSCASFSSDSTAFVVFFRFLFVGLTGLLIICRRRAPPYVLLFLLTNAAESFSSDAGPLRRLLDDNDGPTFFLPFGAAPFVAVAAEGAGNGSSSWMVRVNLPTSSAKCA